jgi:hypothetical protein
MSEALVDVPAQPRPRPKGWDHVDPADPFGPFDHDDFRAGVAALAESSREGGVRWATECGVIARLGAQVPRKPWDTRGPTDWTTFIREIAVARRCSDQAAANEIDTAVALVAVHPRTLALLEEGELPQFRARVLVEECRGLAREAIEAVEAEVADRACRMSPGRIRDAVRQIELRYDGDAAAAREATAAKARSVRMLVQPDGQADLLLSGPGMGIVQVYERLTADAKAAQAAGDLRGLDALRYDLAIERLADDPGDPIGPVVPAADDAGDSVAGSPQSASMTDGLCAEPAADTSAPDRPVPAAPVLSDDRRCSRPIRANITLPVTTALGLDNEPGWLEGYGWISAPQCREWLTLAELRQVCVTAFGQVVDVADRVVRPEPTPTGVREALLAMVENPGPISPKTYEEQPQYAPSDALAEFVEIRDGFRDVPTGRRVPAKRSEKDHEVRYPIGPTAAWNLVDRAKRTHLLKHRGWIPFRGDSCTFWKSPAGQIVRVEHWTSPPPELEAGAELPDPDDLHEVDAGLVRVPTCNDEPPFEKAAGWDDEPPF